MSDTIDDFDWWDPEDELRDCRGCGTKIIFEHGYPYDAETFKLHDCRETTRITKQKITKRFLRSLA